MMTSRSSAPRLAACACLLGGSAGAQVEQEVVQGVEDVSPLRRVETGLYHDLRTPVGWGSVYRVPVTDRMGQVRWMYARKSGAITALFPQSVYNELRNGGLEIAVPPGTIFHLGEVPGLVQPEEQSPAPSPSPMPAASPAPLCVTENEGYRQARMRQLLQNATAAREGQGVP